VALDEELIGKHDASAKLEVLTRLKPKYVILKPTLLGGFDSCRQWIDLAANHKLGWWMTSALESNIGLNAICQFTANYAVEIAQGLGTGSIYTNNIGAPLQVKNGFISFDSVETWEEVNV
jgi:O-succinylbenzoate synthase